MRSNLILANKKLSSNQVKPSFTKEPQDVTGRLLEEVTLECDGKGYPKPTIQWLKLSDDSESDSFRCLLDLSITPHFLLGKTIVKEHKTNRISFGLGKESAGVYRCKIWNSIGSVEKTINVGYLGKLSR